jgi:hypothetical protein
MREELAYRTVMMSEEMEKWRQQAALTANAVLEAKNEVGFRHQAAGCLPHTLTSCCIHPRLLLPQPLWCKTRQLID